VLAQDQARLAIRRATSETPLIQGPYLTPEFCNQAFFRPVILKEGVKILLSLKSAWNRGFIGLFW